MKSMHFKLNYLVAMAEEKSIRGIDISSALRVSFLEQAAILATSKSEFEMKVKITFFRFRNKYHNENSYI